VIIMARADRWIVAADGRRARIFRQTRRGMKPAPERDFEMSQAEADKAYRSDRPPRTQESVGPMRHAIEAKIAPQDDAENAFLRRLAKHLVESEQAGAYGRLVLFAPPRALGILRARVREQAGALIERDFPLDVVDETADELHARLRDAGLR
jgi:protein required for attachment to host cells